MTLTWSTILLDPAKIATFFVKKHPYNAWFEIIQIFKAVNKYYVYQGKWDWLSNQQAKKVGTCSSKSKQRMYAVHWNGTIWITNWIFKWANELLPLLFVFREALICENKDITKCERKGITLVIPTWGKTLVVCHLRFFIKNFQKEIITNTTVMKWTDL